MSHEECHREITRFSWLKVVCVRNLPEDFMFFFLFAAFRIPQTCPPDTVSERSEGRVHVWSNPTSLTDFLHIFAFTLQTCFDKLVD